MITECTPLQFGEYNGVTSSSAGSGVSTPATRATTEGVAGAGFGTGLNPNRRRRSADRSADLLEDGAVVYDARPRYDSLTGNDTTDKVYEVVS